MLQALMHGLMHGLTAAHLVAPPAIWGKMPRHADVVRSGMRHGESEGWQPWLAGHGRLDEVPRQPMLPSAFVLPPGTLAFARRCFRLTPPWSSA